jgi:hypothetical protein
MDACGYHSIRQHWHLLSKRKSRRSVVVAQTWELDNKINYTLSKNSSYDTIRGVFVGKENNISPWCDIKEVFKKIYSLGLAILHVVSAATARD